MSSLLPILLVEDDVDIQQNLKEIFAYEQIPVVSAFNGQEALAYLRSGKPVKMILLDLMMPVMNGYEFLEKMNGEPFAKTPTILLSATTDLEKTARAHDLRFLKKPIDLDQLLTMIAQVK